MAGCDSGTNSCISTQIETISMVVPFVGFLSIYCHRCLQCTYTETATSQPESMSLFIYTFKVDISLQTLEEIKFCDFDIEAGT